MPKTRRGRILSKMPAKGRGTCPVCLNTRVKLLYTRVNSDKISITVCKACTKASAERLDGAILYASNLAFRRKHASSFHKRDFLTKSI